MNDNSRALIGRKRPRHNLDDYTFALFCVLGVELCALRAMLDEIHEDLALETASPNVYVLGELSGHNVVIAVLPEPGNNNSGTVAARLRQDFPSVRAGLLIGVGGGIPGKDTKNDVRLGDVVVAEPTSISEAVVQFDKGKHHGTGQFELTGHLNKPPQVFLGLVKKLKAQHCQDGSKISALVVDALRRHPGMKEEYGYPGPEQDQLFGASYRHIGGDSCQSCLRDRIIGRHVRAIQQPQIHYGTIGTSNRVVRDAGERDRLRDLYNILCVEMEAAGIVDQVPSLVIRGVCDYADSHKNKQWQPYAAATAAAYAKELLKTMPSSKSDTSIRGGHNITPGSRYDDEPTDSAQGKVDQVTADPKYQALQESLKFPRMDARLHNISQALQKTCQWLIAHEAFAEWNDQSKRDVHHGFLWIKGKPGSGKSTLMKTLLSWHKKEKRQYDTFSYFFNARAPGNLEKSSQGLYRSLTHQLIMVCRDAQRVFFEQFFSKVTNDMIEDWTIDELKVFLIDVISSHLQRPLVILVDALDEGKEADIRQLVGFLDELSEAALSSKHTLRICLSSRHYPHISIKHEVSLVMEDQIGHDEDIKEYIHRKLADDESTNMNALRNEIWLKSAGVFLWIVLVIPMLNEAYDRGHRLDATTMSLHLKDIPQKLDELFTLILARNEQDLDDCFTALQWVLFSRRSLSPVELYTAIGITSRSPKFDGNDFDPRRIGRCLLDTTRGLTEISNTEPAIVQFIHETVRDFLRERGFNRIDPSWSGSIDGSSHEKLKVSCQSLIKQCVMDVAENQALDKREHENQKDEMQSKSPFLGYAASFMFEHADIAESFGVSQRVWIKQLIDDREQLSKWIYAKNIFESTRNRRYTLKVPLFFVIADLGLASLMKILVQDTVMDGISSNEYHTALRAACTRGHEAMARILIESKLDLYLSTAAREKLFFATMRPKSENVIDLLVKKGYKPGKKRLEAYCRERSRSTWELRKLFELGCSATLVFMQMCSRGIRTSSPVVRILLDAGADVNAQGGQYGNALQAAAYTGNTSTVQLLLGAGADMNAQGGSFSNALEAAAFGCNTPVTHLLLKAGADVNAQGGHFGNALQAAAAARPGNKSTVQLLLDAGADVNAQGGHHGNALQAAAYTGQLPVVQLLLEAGADVNAQGGHHGNALQAAAYTGQLPVVQLLLEAGADVNAQGGHFGNALQAAAACPGNKSTVQLLLDAGADVNAQGGRHGNALRAAARYADEPIIRLLLEAGAKVNDEDLQMVGYNWRSNADNRKRVRVLLQEAIARVRDVERRDQNPSLSPDSL